LQERESIMANTAPAGHPLSYYYERARSERAAQVARQVSEATVLLAGFARRAATAISSAFQRWSDAHQQAVQERVFWELASSDRRVMDELCVIRSRREQEDA
jgi:hypothetical protein